MNAARRLRTRAQGIWRCTCLMTAVVLAVAMVLPTAALARVTKATLTYELSGNVYDHASFETSPPVPVSGVTVRIIGAEGVELYTLSTDADGRWSTTLGDGTYGVLYDTKERNAANGSHFLGGWYAELSAVPVAFGAAYQVPVEGAPVTGLDTFLETGGTFRGQVTGGGAGLEGTYVEALVAGGDEVADSAYTDPTGFYSLTVPEGGYLLHYDPSAVTPSNYLPRFYDLAKYMDHATTLDAAKGATTTVPTQALPEGGFITGIVSGPVGPAAGVSVQAWGMSDGNGQALAISVPDGSYRVGPLEPGPVAVYFDPSWAPSEETSSFNVANGTHYVMQAYDNARLDAPTTVTVVSGVTVTGVHDTLSNGTSVTARVTDPSDNDLVGLDCVLYGQSVEGTYVEATAAAGGRVTFSGLPLDSYGLYSDAVDYNNAKPADFTWTWYDDTIVVDSLTPLVLPEPLIMQYGGRMSGKVTNSSGTALAGIDVLDWVADGNDFPVASTSGATGAYVLHGVPEGRMKVGFESDGYNQGHNTDYVAEFFNAKPTFRTADVMNVVAVDPADPAVGKIANLNAKLVSGAKIGGTITDPLGDPLDSAEVRLFDVFGNFVDSTWTDAGAYRFRAVPPGIYKVSAVYEPFFPGDPAYPERWYAGKRWFAEATNITVGAGANVTFAHIRLAVGPVVGGKVAIAGTTTGIADVGVAIFDASGVPQDTATTDGDGNWQCSVPSMLAPGSYRVEFDPYQANVAGDTSYGLGWYKSGAGTSTPYATDATVLSLNYGGTAAAVNGYLTESGSASITGALVQRGSLINSFEPGMGLRVQAWGMVGSTWQPVSSAPVNGDTGTFTVSGLHDGGAYKLSVDDVDKPDVKGTLANQFYVADDENAASVSWPQVAATVTVSAGVNDVGHFATQKGGLFIVWTQDQDGHSLENVDVFMEFHAPDGSWWPVDGGYMGYSMPGGEVDLPGEGFYDVPLMPGDYRFRFERYGCETVWYEDALTALTATPVSLTSFTPDDWHSRVDVYQKMTPSEFGTGTIAGADRFQVAYDLAKEAYDGNFAGVTNVVIASGMDKSAADPLSSSGLAGVYKAPILLVNQDSPTLPRPTSNALKAIATANPSSKIAVWIVGGPASVPDALKAQITKAFGGATHTGTMTRFSGSDRYAVATGVSAHIRAKTGATTCFITNGSTPLYFWDALAASPVSYAKHFPILIVRGGYVPPVTKTEAGKFATRYVIGDTAHVPESVRVSLVADRISGTTRADVAARFAATAWDRGWIGVSKIAIGNKLADCLVGGASIGARGGSLLYTGDGVNRATTLDSKSYQFFVNYKDYVTEVYVLGGSGSVNSAAVMSKVNEALGK